MHMMKTTFALIAAGLFPQGAAATTCFFQHENEILMEGKCEFSFDEYGDGGFGAQDPRRGTFLVFEPEGGHVSWGLKGWSKVGEMDWGLQQDGACWKNFSTTLCAWE
ncbi:hypothetical protein OM960_13575 [Defluviimonas sp. CAU 1641]|uniref:Uncharacterized protein n=2 Tax=Defluviimonas salinarum TaxID=2992147 RepID=A0ABT3J4K2_9RHOB|nr:hypothetical protein [Defluviimonas salinarum]